ncbi:MAG TPA: hypothetical protein VH640_30610 [Bryobacteraceae bacterium]
MKNITFSADEDLIERARARATEEKTTLNILFRQWLERYVGPAPTVEEYRRLMERLEHVDAGRKFTRDETNSR